MNIINTLLCDDSNSLELYKDHSKYVAKLQSLNVKYININQFLDFNRQFLNKYLNDYNKKCVINSQFLSLDEYAEKLYKSNTLILSYHQHFPEYRKFVNEKYDENMKSTNHNININFELEYIKSSNYFQNYYNNYTLMYYEYHK
jgi:hypothetical protein